MEIRVLNGKFAIKCSVFENERVRALPKREFVKKFGLWRVTPTYDNAQALRSNFSDEELSFPGVQELIEEILAAAVPNAVDGAIPPAILDGLMPHQVRAIELAWPTPAFAILHRPRCRKTATTIRLASGRHLAGHINRMVVLCPNSIRAVWEAEFKKRAVTDYDLHVYQPGKKKQWAAWLDKLGSAKLSVLVVSIESMSAGGAAEAVKDGFVGENGEKTMIVVDESTRIKNHKSTRTAKIWELGDISSFRIILTGSELTRHPEDLFAQYRFLGVHTLGFDSFFAWRNRYVVMGGFEGKKPVGMRNVPELMDRISQYSHLVRTQDIVNLPDKTFIVREIKPSKEQVELIKSIEKTMEAEMINAMTNELSSTAVQTAMTAMLRCQQIAGGYFPEIDPESGAVTMVTLNSNPKLDELLEVLAEEQGKVVIWARFLPEIEMIMDNIKKLYGEESVVAFYGAVERDERHNNTVAFQNDPNVRYIVANPTCGSMGIELSAASTMVYYSADFVYESRIQSLERCTNLDKMNEIGIIDLVLDLPADWAVYLANEQKADMARYLEQAIHSRTFKLT